MQGGHALTLRMTEHPKQEAEADSPLIKASPGEAWLPRGPGLLSRPEEIVFLFQAPFQCIAIV